MEVGISFERAMRLARIYGADECYVDPEKQLLVMWSLVEGWYTCSLSCL